MKSIVLGACCALTLVAFGIWFFPSVEDPDLAGTIGTVPAQSDGEQPQRTEVLDPAPLILDHFARDVQA